MLVTTMRETRMERPWRAGVREERLRATAGMRHASVALTSWRGRSGRRYVVGVHPLAETDVRDVPGAVLLAVRRDADGTAHLVDVTAATREAAGWVCEVEAQGATEMHVHHLADTDEERLAALEDLRAGDS